MLTTKLLVTLWIKKNGYQSYKISCYPLNQKNGSQSGTMLFVQLVWLSCKKKRKKVLIRLAHSKYLFIEDDQTAFTLI